MDTTPNPKLPSKYSGFAWRLTITGVTAAAWVIWYLLTHRGQPIQLLPSEADIQKMHDWFHWWGIRWIKFIPFFGDIAQCIIVGAIAFPWGMSLTLTAIILPVLSLLRPIRELEVALTVSFYDFCFIRLIYVMAILAFYTEPIVSELKSWLGSWAIVAAGIMYGIAAIVFLCFYYAFIIASIKEDDPFPKEDEANKEPAPG